MPALTKKSLMLLLYLLAVLNAQSQQSTMDITDSLVNHQKQFIIRFDVATGNIYVPVKKIVKNARDKKDKYRLLSFIDEKESIGDDKQHIVEIVKKFDSIGKLKIVDTIYAKKIYKSVIGVKYIKAGRFFRPKVGSFIRMIFENVPKGMDVNVSAEFLDKNLENASTFQGYLNTFGKALDTAVENKAEKKAVEIDQEKEASARKDIEKTTNALKTEYTELEQTGSKLTAMVNDIEKKIKQSIEKASSKNNKMTDQELKDKLLKGIDFWVTQLKNRVTQIQLYDIGDTLQRDTYKTALKEILAYCDTIIDNSKVNAEVVIKLKANVAEFNKLTTEMNDTKNRISGFSSDLTKYKIVIDSIINHKDSLYKAIKDSIYTRRTIYIQPIQVANNDMTILRVTYRKDDKAQNDINREIMLKNKYGFKLDFSTGFIGTGLKDDNYRLEPGLSDSAKILEDPKGNFAVGFALLAHAYVRTGERVNVALNTGLMLNGSNQTINYLAGLSLPLGLEQRFIISGGVSFGKVKRLTTGYETGNTYPATKLSIAAGVPYTEKWKNSWYIGVSYNLSSLTASSRKVVIAR